MDCGTPDGLGGTGGRKRRCLHGRGRDHHAWRGGGGGRRGMGPHHGLIPPPLPRATRAQVSASTELVALGATNLVGSLFSSFVIMGAFGRSAVNDAAGARSPLSQTVSAVVVALLLLFVTPALFYLPSPALGAIIVMAVVKLVDVATVKRLWRVNKGDLLVMAVALLATLFLGASRVPPPLR
jgi:MFS superfamily sulfate permease-like transporter